MHDRHGLTIHYLRLSITDRGDLRCHYCMPAQIVAVCLNKNKGERKQVVDRVDLKGNHGIVGDAHAGEWHRQISLLAMESIGKMQELGRDTPGEHPDRQTMPHPLCHLSPERDCVMPKEGIFARVLRGGTLRPGDRIEIMPHSTTGDNHGI